MKIELISHTPDALNLLLRTKGTRLAHEDDPATWTDEKRKEHLTYMLQTLRSSWEFVHFVFRISGITRATTHQLVRTRAGSYAQESQRTVDVSDHDVTTPENLSPDQKSMFDQAVQLAKASYTSMLKAGVPAGIARGVLPTNTNTSIICAFNLRTLHDMALVRLCTRTAGEYQDMFRAMRAEVLKIYPWCDPFIQVQCVATATCAFERYGRESCPVWTRDLDREAVKEDMRARFWSADRYSAAPVAVDGMSKG